MTHRHSKSAELSEEALHPVSTDTTWSRDHYNEMLQMYRVRVHGQYSPVCPQAIYALLGTRMEADGELDGSNVSGQTLVEGSKKRGRPKRDASAGEDGKRRRGEGDGGVHEHEVKPAPKAKSKAAAKAKCAKLVCWGCAKAFDSGLTTSAKFDPGCKRIVDRLYKVAFPEKSEWLKQQLAMAETCKRLVLNYRESGFLLQYHEELRAESAVIADDLGKMMTLDKYVKWAMDEEGKRTSESTREWQNWFADPKVLKDKKNGFHRVWVHTDDEVRFRNAVTKSKVSMQGSKNIMKKATADDVERQRTMILQDHDKGGFD
eukprot:6334975-Amphidinium_carterae.1